MIPLGIPIWWKDLDHWLLDKGWPMLILASMIVIGVTLYFLFTQQAAALAVWLTYLFMP